MMKKLVLSELAPSSARNVSIQLNRAIENEKKTFWMRGGGSSSMLCRDYIRRCKAYRAPKKGF